MKTSGSFASSYPLEILLADDDINRRTAMKQQLTELGYNPSEAASGSEVLSMAGARRYDVIMMEVLIPGIHGILDCGREKAGQKPIFIAISGARAKNGDAVLMPAEIDGVITRPVDRPEFLLQLKACSVLAGKCFIKSGR